MKTLLVVKTILNQKCSMPLKNQSIFKAGYCKRNLNLTCFTCMKSSFYEKTKYFLPTFLALQFPEKNPPQSIGIDSSTFLYTKWNRFHLPLVEDAERKNRQSQLEAFLDSPYLEKASQMYSMIVVSKASGDFSLVLLSCCFKDTTFSHKCLEACNAIYRLPDH